MSKIVGNWTGKRYDYEDQEKNTFKFLVSKLTDLHNNINVVGIKQSFEDEGALLSDVLTMRRITELCGLSMYVKIGGCEAITDINNCVSMGIDYIIPPMIETKYAFQKFASAIKNINDTKYYFLCETETSYDNLDSILNSKEASILEGVIVGRSDFTKSYGLDKKEVNSKFILEKVEEIFIKSKSKGLKTTMGGNISKDSCKVIEDLFSKKLLDKIETRNMVVSLNDKNVKNLENTIKQVILYEIEWLKFKSLNYTSIGAAYLDRANILNDRID